MLKASAPKTELLLTLAAVSPMFLSLLIKLKPNGVELHPEWILLFPITLYLPNMNLEGLHRIFDIRWCWRSRSS